MAHGPLFIFFAFMSHYNISISTFTYLLLIMYCTGHYLFAKSCNNSQISREGDTAHLISKKFNPASDMQMNFYYILSGDDTGTLKVFLNTGSMSNNVFSKAGDHGLSWYKACVDIPASESNVSISVVASRGIRCNQMFAVDDILVKEGSCPCKCLWKKKNKKKILALFLVSIEYTCLYILMTRILTL